MEGSVAASRPVPFFVGEHAALDFLNTVASPQGEPIEWIGNGGDLLAWLERAQLVLAPVARRFGRAAGPSELDRIADRARALREWLRNFVRKHAGRPLTPVAVRELGRLNLLLAQDEIYRQLEPDRAAAAKPQKGSVVQWRAQRRWRTAEALLEPIAEAIGDFLCHADFRYVRRCERCTLWFYDVSRGHRRRWCSMAVCGNRAKAANHRARARA